MKTMWFFPACLKYPEQLQKFDVSTTLRAALIRGFVYNNNNSYSKDDDDDDDDISVVVVW